MVEVDASTPAARRASRVQVQRLGAVRFRDASRPSDCRSSPLAAGRSPSTTQSVARPAGLRSSAPPRGRRLWPPCHGRRTVHPLVAYAGGEVVVEVDRVNAGRLQCVALRVQTTGSRRSSRRGRSRSACVANDRLRHEEPWSSSPEGSRPRSRRRPSRPDARHARRRPFAPPTPEFTPSKRARPANATTRPPWPVGLNALPRLRRRRGGAPEPCPPRRRMVADSRTAPAVGTSDRRHAAQRHRRDRRCRLAGRRARHAVRPKASACRSSRLARGRSTVENAVGRAAAGLAVGHADGRPRSTPGSTSRPTTASASPGRSPRPPSSGTGSAPPPPARGRRRMADAPSAPSRCGKRGQQGTRWIAAWGRPHARQAATARRAACRRGSPPSRLVPVSRRGE